MGQVALAIQNIERASAQSMANTKRTESLARNLPEPGQKQKLLVEQYKVGHTPNSENDLNPEHVC
jgi:hypothetical protein